MRIHNVNVLNRVVYIEDVDLIQGTAKEDKINLTLDSEWDGLEIKVCFSDGYKNNIMPEKDENGAYVVPWEVMQKPGKVVISVLGVDNKTEQILKHAIGDKFIVHESSTSDITEMTKRTPETLKAMRGFSAYEIAVQHGYSGTEEQWLASLKGDKGDGGYSAYELAQQAGFTGDEAAWRASLKGDKGDRGYSAYELAQQAGFKGTEAEWRASLKGDRGYSAYELAQQAGFKGTIDQWRASLKGDKGDKGDQGIQGIQGVKGDTGAKGEKGDKGDTGAKGDQGIQGIQGIQGDKGDSAYTVAVKNGFEGTETDWLASLKTGIGWTIGSNGSSIVLPVSRTDISDMIVVYYMTSGTTSTPFAYTYLPMPVFANVSSEGNNIPASMLSPDAETKNVNITTSIVTDGIQATVADGSYVAVGDTHYTVSMNTYYKLMNDGSGK